MNEDFFVEMVKGFQSEMLYGVCVKLKKYIVYYKLMHVQC